jgi:hypothetical protein
MQSPRECNSPLRMQFPPLKKGARGDSLLLLLLLLAKAKSKSESPLAPFFKGGILRVGARNDSYV